MKSTFIVLVVGLVVAVNANPRWVKRQAEAAPPPPPDAAAAPPAEQPPAPAPQPAAQPPPPPPPPRETPTARVSPPFQPLPTTGLILADGAASVIGTNIVDTFSCEQKIYGYYADVDNGCKVFHVCVPLQDEQGTRLAPPLRFSFFCNNGTLFNQEALVCDYADGVDCSQATTFYSVNENFGKIDAQARTAAGAAPPPSPPAPRVPPPPAAAPPPPPPPPPAAGATPPAAA